MNEIRYFSMFTGVGGFELGLQQASNSNQQCSENQQDRQGRNRNSNEGERDVCPANISSFRCVKSRSNRDAEYSSEEKNLSDSKGNKSISERQQEGINNQSNNRETQYTKDTGGTLFQNGQEQSSTLSRDLEEIKNNSESGQQIRQVSDGFLRKGNGVRDDSQSLQFTEDSTNTKQFKCVGFSEIDKYASQLLAKRFPNITNYGDATKIEADKLPDFDMLCGGFPCQAFSIAGKRRGFEDTRGTMFFHIARILEVKKPRLVFLENVKGLLNHNKGETFKVILQTLDELGYEVQWMVLNSKFHGVPQNRERVFIIGNLRGTSRPEILPFRTNESETIEQQPSQVSNAITQRYYKQGNADTYVVGTLDSDGWEKRHEQIRRVWSTTGNAPTIPTAQGGGVMTKIAEPSMKIRRLTPLECERLQGFPDGWTEGFSDTQTYKMMGNAVTTNVIKVIGERLK